MVAIAAVVLPPKVLSPPSPNVLQPANRLAARTTMPSRYPRFTLPRSTIAKCPHGHGAPAGAITVSLYGYAAGWLRLVNRRPGSCARLNARLPRWPIRLGGRVRPGHDDRGDGDVIRRR